MPRKQKAVDRKFSVPQTPRALTVESLDDWAVNLSLIDLHAVVRRLNEAFYWWMGWPTAARADRLIADIPLLGQVFDVAVLKTRWATIAGPPETARKAAAGPYEAHFDEKGGMLCPGLAELAPELVDVHAACVAAIKAAGGNALERAEAWLGAIAEDAGTDGDLEALVYFASRGRSPLKKEQLYERWFSAVCRDVSRVMGDNSPEIAAKAEAGAISLDDAAQFLSRHHMRLRFLTFPDSEDASIDATFTRAVDWMGVPGFSAWVADAVDWLACGPDAGLDGEASWRLFLALRSDLALTVAGPGALDAWLFKFVAGGLEKGRPWIEQDWKTANRVSRLEIAASLVFVWHRAKDAEAAPVAVSEAVTLLVTAQLGNGAWPTLAGDSDGCLSTTCVAVHALALARPPGWDMLVGNAVSWLRQKQDVFGYWHIAGGPAVLLTVLALDCLALAVEGSPVTFTKNRPANVQLPAASEPVEPEYSFENELWFNPAPREFRGATIEECATSQAPILLVVATEIELAQVLRVLRFPYRKRKLSRVSTSNGIYFVGRFGVFAAVVVQCTMGTEGPAGATLTVDHAIQEWRPRAVVMVGIAFGMDRTKQRPGDVLVARTLIPYEPQRVGGEREFRGSHPESSPVLFSRFRGAVDWEFSRPDGTVCARIDGALLTGAKLIDSDEFKTDLGKQFPTAIGGEMEGAGVWSASVKSNKAWILVKGVCDWADGQKKKKYQGLAAAAAVSLCLRVFQDEHALDGIPEP